jgi:hypothetical protein
MQYKLTHNNGIHPPMALQCFVTVTDSKQIQPNAIIHHRKFRRLYRLSGYIMLLARLRAAIFRVLTRKSQFFVSNGANLGKNVTMAVDVAGFSFRTQISVILAQPYPDTQVGPATQI